MELTITELKDLMTHNAPTERDMPLMGQKVFIRTVTYHYTGRFTGVQGGFMVLEDAAWVALSGRWGKALREGSLEEVEPYPGTTYVNVDSIVDYCEWSLDLPRQAK